MIIYGKNPIKDLFEKDFKQIKKVWVNKKRHFNFVKQLEEKNIPVFDFNELQLNSVKLTGKENIQGIVANITEPKIFSLDELISLNSNKKAPKILILDKVEDPQNFGAILRNAAAFNIDGVIYSKSGGSSLNSTVMKASAGNWMNVNLCETGSLNSVIKILKENFYWIVSTSLDANTSLDKIKDLDQPLAIVFGNEGKGVRSSIQDKSDFKIKIKMNKNVESLNVASSSAIILHYLFSK